MEEKEGRCRKQGKERGKKYIERYAAVMEDEKNRGTERGKPMTYNTEHDGSRERKKKRVQRTLEREEEGIE